MTRSIDSHLSLFVSPLFLFFVQAMPAAAVSLQRKKSLPDVAQPIQLTATAPLSREEVSVLSSMRREEIRRQIDESERLRANPLLYLVSPQVKVSIVIEFQKSFLKIYLYEKKKKNIRSNFNNNRDGNVIIASLYFFLRCSLSISPCPRHR